MKWLCVLTILLSIKTLDAIKILAVFGLPGRSNSFLGHALVKLLSEAGHEITYITPRPPAKEIPGVKVIDVSNVIEHYNPDEYANLKDILSNIPEVDKMIPLRTMVMDLSQILVENPNVQELLADANQNFELVIAEWAFNELLAGFAAVYNCPYIWFSTVIPHWMILQLVDDSTNPSYNADFLSKSISPFTFKHRINELLSQIWGQFAQFYLSGMENTLYEKLFAKFILNKGHNLPSWKEIKYNASLVLSNSHISFTMPERLPQNVIPIGGFHIDSTPPTLSEDLKLIMDNAPNGVIYFSLGSNFKSKHLPDTMKQELLETFGKLKQTVLWKFEEDLPNLPPNVYILNWASQHSILAHKNCILLITHGGLLSMTETVHYGVPVIGLPVRGDQFLNVNIAVNKGYAVKIDFSYNLAKDLDDALKEILNEPRYSIKAKEASIIYHHRSLPPAKELVHWVELVAKTTGASHLRSAALILPWYQKYYIDLAAIIIGLIWAVYYVIRTIGYKICGKKKND